MKNNIIKILLILNIVIISNTNSMSRLYQTFIRGLVGSLSMGLGHDLINKKIENENKINEKTLNAKIINDTNHDNRRAVLYNSIANVINTYAFLVAASVFSLFIYSTYKEYNEKSNEKSVERY